MKRKHKQPAEIWPITLDPKSDEDIARNAVSLLLLFTNGNAAFAREAAEAAATLENRRESPTIRRVLAILAELAPEAA